MLEYHDPKHNNRVDGNNRLFVVVLVEMSSEDSTLMFDTSQVG